ncbi:hypothetical protein GCM10009122_44080 [Fulvivirga kasyanovii]|uniref:chondroitinase-B domain-containing protein n=1 Tax=Fulvivirga kasyanovii TaxID=396812 RepID=UPI0031DA4CB3
MVDNLEDLDREITNLENNSAHTSTTIIVADATYESLVAPALNRYISPTGGCACTIKAATDYKVNFRGRVFWRLYNSKNLTIRGINFIRTQYVPGKPPVVDFSGGSNNKIINGIFAEAISSVPSGNNYYIQFYEGNNNAVDNIFFKHKYSYGHYVNMYHSNNNKLINSTFVEVSKIDKEKNFYVQAIESEYNQIKNCSFSNKMSYGDYIYIGGGANNIIDSNTFSESDFPKDSSAEVTFRNRIDYYDGIKYYVDLHKGDRQIVKNNTFHNKFSHGHFIDISDYESDQAKNHHQIIDNYFGNMYLRDSTEYSMIKIGMCGGLSTADVDAGILVEGNTFENYNYTGEQNTKPYTEVISNKSSGNSYINNTFINCGGYLRLRCGDNVTVIGNRFCWQKPDFGRRVISKWL